MRWLIIFFSLLTWQANAQILPKYGDSRTGSTGFQFLKINPDARSTGMAESNSATVDDLSSMLFNPAGLSQIDTSSIHIAGGMTQYMAGSSLKHCLIGKKINYGTSVGVQVIQFGSGEMPVTTEFMPSGTGQTFRFNDLCVGVSLAKILTDNFSFGVSLKYLNERTAGIINQNMVADFGFQYNVGKGHTRFAVAISNFGAGSKPDGNFSQLTLLGQSAQSSFEAVAVPAIFRLSISKDILFGKEHALTVNGQLNHPTDNNETLAFGAEYSWRKTLYARTGYTFGMDEKGFPCAGLGYTLPKRWGGFQVNYSFITKPLAGPIHRLGFSFNIR